MLLVVACVAMTVLLRMGLQNMLQDTAPLLAFVLPVTICAALGGFWVGVLATFSSAIAGTYLFNDVAAAFDASETQHVVRVMLFLMNGLVISGVSGKMHSEIARTLEAERRVAARESLLSEANSRLRLTLDAAGAGTWDWDVIRDKLVWSQTNYLLYGVDPKTNPVTNLDSWLGKLHPTDRAVAEAELRRLMLSADEDTYRAEVRIMHPHKGERWFLRLGRVDRDARGRATRVLGINIDITDRKRVEEGERAARSEAERANRMKDEFVATVSHELRTPLTAILGWAQLLKRPQRDPDKLARGLEIIERNARVLTQLVADLLDVGRIVTGKLRLETSPIDLGVTASTAVDTVRPIAQAKGVKLVTHISPIDEPLIGDRARVEQIVWNLVSNAIKFTPRDGTVEVRAETRGAWAVIVVRDTGQGIAAEFVPHLFERFRQQDASASSRMHGGLGLGLAIVKHLAELHGGHVLAESAGIGCGATFTVELPLASTASLPVGASENASGPSTTASNALGGVRVLLVEDEFDTREFVRRVLEESSAEVVSAGSAAEALAVIDQARPDVVVSDIGMPGMDGYALVRAIQVRHLSNEKAPIPALALTAFARSEDRERAFDAGFAEHLTKPVDPATLVTAVARLFQKAHVVATQTRGA
jgi:signal transduction histidine kinase/CheY-like chemotaxis protein